MLGRWSTEHRFLVLFPQEKTVVWSSTWEISAEPTGCSGGRADSSKGCEIPAGFMAVWWGVEKDASGASS